jgi:glycine reductase complex component B subunit gamma
MESRGLATVSLTNMPFVTEKIGVPRAVAVEFPFGMIWGHPEDREMQGRLLEHMFEAVETIREPGTIIELPYTWPEEDFRKRDWFPKEPTPWLASQEGINQMMDFLQHGDPME